MRRLVALTVCIALAASVPAQAKGTAEVCGAMGCTTVTDPGVVGPLRSTFGPAPAPRRAPFYVVRFCSDAGCGRSVDWSYLYVPSAGAMRGDNIGSGRVRWMRASLLAPLLGPLTQGLAPYPASATWKPRPASEPAAAAPTRAISWIALASFGAATLVAISTWRWSSGHVR